MKKYILFSLYMSLLSVAMQYFLFPTEIYASGCLVFIYSLCLYLILLGKSKILNICLSVFVHLSFIVLLIYHLFFTNVLSIKVLTHQYQEGIYGFFNALTDFCFPLSGWYVVFSLIISVIFLFLFTLRPLQVTIKTLLALPLLIIFLLSYYNYYRDEFSQYKFNSTAKMMGYPMAWGYEVSTYSSRRTLLKYLKMPPQTRTFEELKNIPLRNNIYIIQFESLDYSAVQNGAAPFIKSLLDKSIAYKIIPHEKQSSANADCQVLLLKPLYKYSFSVLYKMLPPSFFLTNQTLPKVLSQKGYKSYFYHGNMGEFFNRRAAIEAMGFDEVYFKEELNQTFNTGPWGVQDADVATFINSKAVNSKSLHFFITVSSHSDWILGKKYTSFIAHPKTEYDRYLNTIHYADSAIKTIIEHAPKNSLFLIYSDHDSSLDSDKTTLFLLFDKLKPLKLSGIIRMDDVASIVHQLVTQHH